MSQEIIELLIHIIKAEPYKEITGFLLIDKEKQQEFIRMKNLSGNPNAFFILDNDVLLVKRYADFQGLKIIGFIHSHNGSTEMSNHDIHTFKTSEFDWIIVALVNESLRIAYYNK